MQDEIVKHTKKIYDMAKDKKHSLSEKLKDIAIEIFIIVFAVTLSIWLHSWSERRKEQKEAHKFLFELKEDLLKDIIMLDKSKVGFLKADSNLNYLKLLKENKDNDSVIGPHTTYMILGMNFNSGRYEGFKSSGKISTIENDSLKNLILDYYQQVIPNFNLDMNYINELQLRFNNYVEDEYDKYGSIRQIFYSSKAVNLISTLEFNFRKNAIPDTNDALNEINKIIAEIDKETKE